MRTALLAIAAALIGAGNGLQDFANDAENPNAAPATPTGDGEAPKRRGRPPGAAAIAKAAEPVPGAAAEAAAEDDATRFERNRALIKPLVDAAQGEDVKKVIAKYSKDGLKALPAASQADFEKDIAALSY